MLVPLKWLSEFVDHGMTPEELSHVLTMSGLEVEGVIERHAGLAQVLVAKVLEVKPHPQADRLRLARVDYGKGESEIVCGAPNLAPGMLSALALPGAVLAGDMKVKKTKIRGVASVGMLCSERELGLSDDHSGIMDLDADLTVGQGIVEALNLETRVLEISITPNRGDALSILGVARDVAALQGAPLRLPEVSFEEHDPPIDSQAAIQVSDPKGCPRYAARLVRDIKIGPGPLWMADRLSAAGIRPISNVVDVSNYVLLERGQPLHTFDFARLAGGRIDVRQAEPGEIFTTLDGQERKLEQGMLLICDGERPVAVAGVMGGLNSEIEDDSKDVLIESAYFAPFSIRRTSKRLGLSTEASYRFERGIDLAGCMDAADRAAQLIAQLSGGQVAKGFIDVYPESYQAPKLNLSVNYTSRYLGLPLTKDEVRDPLERLGLKVSDGGEDSLMVEPPAFRPDLERPVDLTEEVARMKGFDKFPARSPRSTLSANPRPWRQKVREKLKDLMAAQGFDEIITYSFGHPQAAERLGLSKGDPRLSLVKLMNPLSEDQSVLRTSLMPGLLETLRRNLDQRQEDVALFEVGKVFWDRPGEKQPHEPSRLGALLCGLAGPASWWSGEAKVSLAHIRGAVEYVFAGLEIEQPEFVPSKSPSPYLEPDTCCSIELNGQVLGELGRITKAVGEAFDVEKPAYVLELDFDLLVECAPQQRSFTPLPRYPEVSRDLAMVVDEAIGAGEVLAQAKASASGKLQKWLYSVELFDIYRGKPLDKNQKSLGIRFRYRDDKKTLREKEVVPQHEKLVESLLESFNGVRR